MVRCIIYNNINSDIFQCSLCILCKLRLFETGRVSQPVNAEFLSVFVYISITVCICPSGFFKKLLCTIRIIGNGFYSVISIGKAAREGCFCRNTTSLHDHRTESVFVDSHLNSFADILVLHDL